MLTNKKGFTLIELIVVMAILAVLALLTVPNFLNHTQEATLTQIKSSIKTVETDLYPQLLSNKVNIPDLEVYDGVDEVIEEGRLFDVKGGVAHSLDGVTLYKVPNANSNLPGTFLTDSDGEVYYVHTKDLNGTVVKSPEEGSEEGTYGPNGEFIPEGYTLAIDADFTEIEQYGQMLNLYTGIAEYVVIPHKIRGVPVTSYEAMFQGSTVKGVASNNPYVTNMTAMFYQSQATSLDLSNLDTSNVTTMHSMFWESQAVSINLTNFDTSKVTIMCSMFGSSKITLLDLSSFDTSNVTDMGLMFNNSISTTGYAGTQADADRFNASEGKPVTLTFILK